jgi:CIC family chloride channel protein
MTGIGAGLSAMFFRYLIDSVAHFAYVWIPNAIDWGDFPKAYVLIVPAVGGLLAGPLIYFFAREAKGHGVPEVMESVALRGGRIRPVVAVIKSVASSVTIGSGGSAGREGPIVQIGSALGSSLGQIFHLSDGRVRTLVACGAAGGIAATFNAPIAGVLFALEVIIGEFSMRYFSTVVIAAVTASVVVRPVIGSEPSFITPMEYGVNSTWEYALYPLLGLASALVGAAFIRVLYWSEDTFEAWKAMPEWLRPAIGGLMLGGVAMAYPYVTGVQWDNVPQIFNVGYDVIIESALSSELVLSSVLVLLVLKLVATSLTLGSGGSGGVFAPSLFMGAMVGTAFALIVQMVIPDVIAPPGAYALLGMGGVFAASAQAPITAVIILFELTGDYKIILPLMLTVVVSSLLGRRLMKGESIYTLKLSRRGIRLERGRDLDVMQAVTIGEVMNTDPETVDSKITVGALTQKFRESRVHGFPVLQDRKLLGIVTISDLTRATADENADALNVPVTDIMTPLEGLMVAYPNLSMGEALNRMGTRGIGRLPVVREDKPDELLGMIRRQEITRAYRLAISRRAEQQHQARQMALRNIDQTQFAELTVKKDDYAVGRTVSELARQLPEDSILISVRRGNRVFMPHGDTKLRAGDQVTAFVRNRDKDDLVSCICEGEIPDTNGQPQQTAQSPSQANASSTTDGEDPSSYSSKNGNENAPDSNAYGSQSQS